MEDLKGKEILVTGGSRGIGAGIVKHLDSCKARLAFTYSSQKDSAYEILKTLNGSQHKIYHLDVSDEANVESVLKQILADFPKLEGLVNNAGITRDQILLRMKVCDFDKVIQTNLKGSFLCTKFVLKHMIKNKKGALVHISSVVGQKGQAGQANYSASKAGLEAFSKSVALEVASRGIRSNCIAPGFISTDMTQQLNTKQTEAIISQIPFQQLGTPKDIAHACSFFLSESSRYITGQTLGVNGGLYM